MKFKTRQKIESGLKSIHLVALIDIVFLILMALLISHYFISPSMISVKLPKAITSDILREENLIVTITSEDVVYFKTQVLTLKELEVVLRHVPNKNRALLIRAHRRASLGRIVDVWNLCRNLNLEKINIATTQEE